ncbi:hypothetical protein [Chryseobacterium sp. Leaf201]|uniref:hypothetical protein n=1 Tax=Chryseobacterium sp. Leaf201 TaxID=1735672 RepID=UPI0006FC1F1E|nr:hypothetical protein [Chryseobacterium sp. Leaf201]KQM48921.1 hypothetical protein ASE55_10345 [Chryseobacterium sp. Leaf201]
MKKLFLMFFLIIAAAINAQKMTVISGDFKTLKDQTEVNVELKFDNVLMMKENFTEAQYLKNRKRDLLANPKRGEAGWQKWNGEWQRFKNEEYINYFVKGLNRSYKNITFKKESHAKYTLLLETDWVFPGWHGGMVVMTAEISGKIKLIETNNPSVVLAEVELNKFDKYVNNKEFVMEYGRVAGAYESIGKYLGREIKEAVK